MKTTQEQFIVKNLVDNGFIRRNACLKHYISRLGARICDLNKAGWDIRGHNVKTPKGKDYEYRVFNFPKSLTKQGR
jgi:hypothetical protein